MNFSHQLLQKKRQGSRMSKVGGIRDEESESGVRMMRGLLVVELFSKSYFVDVVVPFHPLFSKRRKSVAPPLQCLPLAIRGRKRPPSTQMSLLSNGVRFLMTTPALV